MDNKLYDKRLINTLSDKNNSSIGKKLIKRQKEIKDNRIIINLLEDYEDNKYFIYRSNLSGKLELINEDFNKKSIILLK